METPIWQNERKHPHRFPSLHTGTEFQAPWACLTEVGTGGWTRCKQPMRTAEDPPGLCHHLFLCRHLFLCPSLHLCLCLVCPFLSLGLGAQPIASTMVSMSWSPVFAFSLVTLSVALSAIGLGPHSKCRTGACTFACTHVTNTYIAYVSVLVWYVFSFIYVLIHLIYWCFIAYLLLWFVFAYIFMYLLFHMLFIHFVFFCLYGYVFICLLIQSIYNVFVMWCDAMKWNAM